MRRLFNVLSLVASICFVTGAMGQTPESETIQTSIAGTGISHLRGNSNDEVAVADFGTDDTGRHVQFVIHNGTEKTVHSVQVKVEVRDNQGVLLAAETSQTTAVRPQTLDPGDFAVGYIYLNADFSGDLDLNVRVVDSESGQYPYAENLSFKEVNMFGDRIVGEFVNEANDDLGEAILVGVCYDKNQVLIAGDRTFLEEPMPLGEPVSFQLDVSPFEDAPCETFIIAG